MDVQKGIRLESGTIPSLCKGAVFQNHWFTGKGEAAMNEVRRSALAWNLRSAVYSTFVLMTYIVLIVSCRILMLDAVFTKSDTNRV